MKSGNISEEEDNLISLRRMTHQHGSTAKHLFISHVEDQISPEKIKSVVENSTQDFAMENDGLERKLRMMQRLSFKVTPKLIDN